MSPLGASPDAVARLALVHLPGLGPARGNWLLSGPASAAEVLAALAGGALPPGLGPPPAGLKASVLERWRQALRALDPVERWEAHADAGLRVLTPADADWPFVDDPDPPVVLWARGRLELLRRRPVVAVVGSRRCTHVGARVAAGLGRDLAAAGVLVASGLAAGIDAAAHRGALQQGRDVIGVVGTGADVVYPASSADLWEQVGSEGLLVGEAPLGTRGERWRFPARNRLVAALSSALVVVESHAVGGALHTVAEAERRHVPVLAVPGSVTSAASAGTNQLLFDGAFVARDAADVLTLLGLSSAPASPPAVADAAGSVLVAELLAAVAAGPLPLQDLLAQRSVAEVAVVLHRLSTVGLVEVRGGMVSSGPGEGRPRCRP